MTLSTGVTLQVHGVTGNDNIFRVKQPDIFGQLRKKGFGYRRRDAQLLVMNFSIVHRLIQCVILNTMNPIARPSITDVFTR